MIDDPKPEAAERAGTAEAEEARQAEEAERTGRTEQVAGKDAPAGLPKGDRLGDFA